MDVLKVLTYNTFEVEDLNQLKLGKTEMIPNNWTIVALTLERPREFKA